MLTESIFKLSACSLKIFCRRFDAGVIVKGIWALDLRKDSVIKKIQDILLNQLNSSSFDSKSQNSLFLLPESYPTLLIQQKSSKFALGLSLNEAEIIFPVKAVNAILICLCMCLAGFSQQNNNWYFGRQASISFNASGTLPVPRSLTNSNMLADEAAASVSDKNGSLLFYTNGVIVYNKLHQIMLNGDNLAGNISTTQVAIVQVPGNDSIFYIFTADAIENDFQNGYLYSIVNMNRDAGKGEVISKNVLLHPSCTERMTTVRHANGTDVWLITNDKSSNTFRSWLINCNGLQPGAIVSVVGDILDQYREVNSGVMKVSPDGKMLCQTHFPLFDELTHPPNYIQIFNFDNATGILSNARSIGFPDSRYTHCEFSPDSKLLYLTRPYDKKADQLKITLPTVPAIQASRVVLSTGTGYFDLQLAPDEKIYFSQPGSSLAVINKPNLYGTGCNFLPDQVTLLAGSTYLGLPSHINDISAYNDPNNGFTYIILDSCSGKVQFNAHTTMTGAVLWEWDFGDGSTSALQNPVHTFFPSNSIYTVKLKISVNPGCGQIYRSALIKPSGLINNQPDFDYIVRCDSGYVRFINKTQDLQDLGALMTWDFGDGNTSTVTDPLHVYASSGIYTVKLKLNTGLACLDKETSKLVEVKDFSVVAPPDQAITVGQSVFLSTTEPGISFQWTPGTWLNDSTIRNPVATPLADIVYTVTGTNSGGCKGMDSIRIHVLQYDDIFVPSAFTPNEDGRNDLIRAFYPGSFALAEFSVFDRWGHRIFSTSQRNNGWNGKVNGISQPSGVYVWLLKATDKSGAKIEKKGTFVLIR